MQFQRAKVFILDKLKNELPGYLSYHSVAHVVDVYQAAENLGISENVSNAKMTLLLTAALFHDAGFIRGAKEHEGSSCLITREHLPGFGYSADDIKKINGMIMATKLPQLPKNQLEKIICDADLDYLGRDDFFAISDKLFKEFRETGVVQNENDWNKLQVAFFESHHYFTVSALSLREAGKQKNLLAIKSKIK